MEKEHKQRIAQNLTDLIAHTRLDGALEAQLVETGIFPAGQLEEVMAAGDAAGRKRKLYMAVQRRGPKAFHGLVTALAQSGNGRAAGILDPYSEPVQEGEPRSLGKVWNPPNYQEAPVPPAAPYRPDSTTPLEVKVVRAAQGNTSTARAAKCYRMVAKPRGLVLIIDNENFQHDVLSTRTGSLVDSNNLDILFGQLGFRVTLRRNLGYHEMIQEVQKFSGRTEEHEAADMAVLCILSHGRHGLVAAADGRELETEWVLRQINNDGCPALRGKPKLVILQACRGDEADYGVAPAVTFPEERTASDARMVEPPASQQYKQLSWEDMVVAYATLPGYVANRDRYRGTWFVESLCKVFMEMAADTDLRDMLDVVGEKLKGYESEMGTKQSFAYEVRHFYKKLFFNPE